MEHYVKKFFYFHIFSFFLGFRHDFIRCIHFTYIAANDDVTNYVTHRIFNTDLLYYCAHFVVKIYIKNLAIMAGFNKI